MGDLRGKCCCCWGENSNPLLTLPPSTEDDPTTLCKLLMLLLCTSITEDDMEATDDAMVISVCVVIVVVVVVVVVVSSSCCCCCFSLFRVLHVIECVKMIPRPNRCATATTCEIYILQGGLHRKGTMQNLIVNILPNDKMGRTRQEWGLCSVTLVRLLFFFKCRVHPEGRIFSSSNTLGFQLVPLLTLFSEATRHNK